MSFLKCRVAMPSRVPILSRVALNIVKLKVCGTHSCSRHLLCGTHAHNQTQPCGTPSCSRHQPYGTHSYNKREDDWYWPVWSFRNMGAFSSWCPEDLKGGDIVEVQTIVVFYKDLELIYFSALPSLTRVCQKGKQVHLSTYLFIYSFAYFREHCPIWNKYLRRYLAYSFCLEVGERILTNSFSFFL